MILSDRDINVIFETISTGLKNPNISDYVERLRPDEPELLDWRFKLHGAIGALEAAGQTTDNLSVNVYNLLFGQPAPGKRAGRDHQYSVDVDALSPTGALRHFTYDVAAQNSLDAYVQLAKRLVYRAIPDVVEVRVFAGLKSERKPQQSTARVFTRKELIYVKATGKAA